ncbi:MAG TPA: transposase [Aggregatilineaceae bacterium]|nr:transposase [Aggregatilineaceae bacterium]
MIELLALIDMVWIEAELGQGKRGGPKCYSEKTLFKVYVVSWLKPLWAHRSLWRYLSSMPLVASACGLVRIPDRRTLDRRLAEIAPQAEVQIQALGLTLSLEAVTDATVAARDGSAFATPGPVWHKKDKAAGIIPEGLHGVDTEADWIQSEYHGWVYGYKAHVSISVTPTTVRVVLGACVTGSACESHVWQARVKDLPPLLRTLLLDAGYDDGDLIATCAERGIEVLAPLSKPVGQATSQDRRDRAAYLASPEGKARYRQRGSRIEPFFGTVKDFFHLDPLPLQGKTNASVFILLALYAWNLIVVFNFVNDRLLGAVKSVLDLL